MMSTTSFTLLVVGILLSGPIIGFILYKILPKKKDTSIFLDTNHVPAKFDNAHEHENSIDEIIEEFKLLDI